MWFEEADCQTHGLKKQVVGIARNSLQVREVAEEVISQRDPNCSYSSQRIRVWPVVEALQGKWGSRRNVEQRRSTLLGWDMHVGNEMLKVVSVSWP
jgi:hypothetical protein